MSFRDRGGRYGDSRYQREGMSGTTGGWNSGAPSQMYPDPSVAPPYGGPMPPGPQNFGPGPPGMMPPPMPVGGPMPGGPGPQQMPGFQLGENRGPLGSYGNMQGNLPYPPMGGPGYNNQGPGFNPQQQGAPGFNQFPLNEQPGGPPFHQPPVNYGPDFGRCGDEFQREFGPDGRFGPAMRNDRPHSDSDGRDRGPEDGYYRNTEGFGRDRDRQGGRIQDNRRDRDFQQRDSERNRLPRDSSRDRRPRSNSSSRRSSPSNSSVDYKRSGPAGTGRQGQGGRSDRRLDSYEERQGSRRLGPAADRRENRGDRRTSPVQYSSRSSKTGGRDSSRERSRRDNRFSSRKRSVSRDRGSDSPRKQRRADSRSRDSDRESRSKPPRQAEGSRGSPPPGTSRQSETMSEKMSDDGDGGEDNDDSGEPALPAWQRCSPADLYFQRQSGSSNITATKRMQDLEDKFEAELVKRAEKARAAKPKYERPPRKMPLHFHCHSDHHDSSSSSSSSSEDEDEDEELNMWLEEMKIKKQHPERLHEDLWFNEVGEMNDGPICRCSWKARQTGIRHNIFPGEKLPPKCNPDSNNLDKLYHYRITMAPHTNFLTKNPTVIEYDSHEYIFEGFSIFSHQKLDNIPLCQVTRFSIPYTIHFFEEQAPENFTVRSLDLFSDFLFTEILELVDLDWHKVTEDGCRLFHIMPRFARNLPERGKEILSINEVFRYLLRSSQPLFEASQLSDLVTIEAREWQALVEEVRGMLVTCPGMRPSAVRVDQLDKNHMTPDSISYPLIIHFGIKPAKLSYVGDPSYQKLWKEYLKLRHLMMNKPKIMSADKEKIAAKEEQLSKLRLKRTMKREVTIELSAENFIKTGIRSDVCQHALLLPVLITHLRFHMCLGELENIIQYNFKDRSLLQLAMTHSSYKLSYGTNPDHARNSLSACGLRTPEYGEKVSRARKRGLNVLINIMSRMGFREEQRSHINTNERLEFLGDAVIEFLTSVHLFYMFPELEEGGLATYRAALVQNQHLSVLAKKIQLHKFMLYAHGPDLCRDSAMKHAMANCFEALLGALLIDSSIEVADRIVANTLFADDPKRYQVWTNLPLHPLQDDEPGGDRHWIEKSPVLQKLTKFEENTGIKFSNIRILAKCFTTKRVPYNNLTMGNNQRLELLGDTIMNLIAAEYLYKHFPGHHEGHLSLLRSSLVNNHNQALVAEELGMLEYLNLGPEDGRRKPVELKTKGKADTLEAFVGALYVDKDLQHCEVFCQVCFFPRLTQFILNQEWNDPKSQLQQCCLTLRELNQGEPDRPVYKTLGASGATNTRQYQVAVYFRGQRLARGTGQSIRLAEMAAARNALEEKADMFPQLEFQKKFIEGKYDRRLRDAIKLDEQDDVFKNYSRFVESYTQDKLVVEEENSNLPMGYREPNEVTKDEKNKVRSKKKSKSATE